MLRGWRALPAPAQAGAPKGTQATAPRRQELLPILAAALAVAGVVASYQYLAAYPGCHWASRPRLRVVPPPAPLLNGLGARPAMGFNTWNSFHDKSELLHRRVAGPARAEAVPSPPAAHSAAMC